MKIENVSYHHFYLNRLFLILRLLYSLCILNPKKSIILCIKVSLIFFLYSNVILSKQYCGIKISEVINRLSKNSRRVRE